MDSRWDGINSYVPGPSSLGAKWFRYRVSIHHPFGLNWHPLEVACRYSQIDKYAWIFNILIYTHERGVTIIITIMCRLDIPQWINITG